MAQQQQIPWTRYLDAPPPYGYPVRLQGSELGDPLPGYFILHVDGYFYRLSMPCVVVPADGAHWVSVH